MSWLAPPKLSKSLAKGGGNSSSSSSGIISQKQPPTRCRTSTLCIPHSDKNATTVPTVSSDAATTMHCEIEYDEDDCAITSERLRQARDSAYVTTGGSSKPNARNRQSCFLTESERRMLQGEQKTIRKTLFLPAGMKSSSSSLGASVGESMKTGGATLKSGGANIVGGMAGVGKKIVNAGMSIKEQMQLALLLLEDVDEDDDSKEEEEKVEWGDIEKKKDGTAPPQDISPSTTDIQPTTEKRHSVGTVKAQLLTAKLRARVDKNNTGVLGIQCADRRGMKRFNSVLANPKLSSVRANPNFIMYNLAKASHREFDLKSLEVELNSEEEDAQPERTEEKKEMDVEDISYVRKPNLARIIEEREAMLNHPKYTLKQVVLSRRFHLYAHRFGNAQYQRTLVYPTLRQPEELYSCPWLKNMEICGECKEEPVVTEKQRTREGHRFIIAADTQFGILMDGFAMDFPNWSQEIEISRKCVKQINAMTGKDRPLFVSMCGDLVDTESSFSGAIASWKKVMQGWERNLVFEQQVADFKRVWAGLDADIALVCLCGNHDVGNRPTRASIKHWTNAFGDDFLSFWVNGTFNLCLNNCLFSNPTGAPDLFQEQLEWMEDRLAYARENDATHIFVHGHFPWFLKHEEEADDYLTSYSAAPDGWGPPGSSFADSYFTIPYEQRKIAMALFKKYDVTACFSGHFHQNVVAKTSWGMPMIVTGPLSMNLSSEIAEELSNGESNGLGMRVVDVGEAGEFTHKWTLLDDEDELYEHAMERCIRQAAEEEVDGDGGAGDSILDSLFDEVHLSPQEAMKWQSHYKSNTDIGDT